MKTVPDALHQILAEAPLLEGEALPLSRALGRVLRQDAMADGDLPPFDCSAMDGYACRAGESAERLAVVAEIQAGASQPVALQPGECARIFTGARIPEGAAFVAMQEAVERLEEPFIRTPAQDGPSYIRHRGENCRRGDCVVPSGRRLGALELAALASCGVANPKVSRRPRVVHFVTGDELIDPGLTPTGTQIRDCNSVLVASLLAASGADLVHHSHLADDLESAWNRFSEGANKTPDLLLISGGASVGDYDYARPLLERAGFTPLFHGINLRPGKPLLAAKRGRQLAFGLPGNPVSHAVIFALILAPLLAAMQGEKRAAQRLSGYLEDDLSSRPNARETYRPCHVEFRGGAFRIRPLSFQSSGDITGAAGANALLHVPAHRGGIKKSDVAEFLWLQSASW